MGGYILFPADLARADLIAVTLKAMELAPDEFEVRLPEDGIPLLPEEGFPFRTEEPPERALALLAQEPSGVIQGRASKGAEIFWFEPPIEAYLRFYPQVGSFFEPYRGSTLTPEAASH